jgi:hypothetical protein
MATELSSKPVFNKRITELFSGMKDSLASVSSGVRTYTIDSKDPGFPFWGMLIVAVLAVIIISWWIRYRMFLETPYNIASILRDNMKAADHYNKSNLNRKGLPHLYNTLISKGYAEENLGFTNFYVSTVNASGIFFPRVNGIVSADAARLACVAGARAFVFDIWPDVEPGGRFGPTIQVIESGSMWRRTTLNALPFVYILQAIVREALQTTSNPGYQDPLILYLRFRGNPRASTFDQTADALASLITPYRLDLAFNNCRGADRLFKVPISQLFSKVIVVSNLRGVGRFMDFVNFSIKDGIKLEYPAGQLQTISGDQASEAKKKILMNPTFVAPMSEDSLAESNDYSVPAAQALGIHFVAMNFWKNTKDKALAAYMQMFGKYSFVMKQPPLQYIITHLDPPRMPPNPGWGDNTTGGAGKPTTPPDIRPPG